MNGQMVGWISRMKEGWIDECRDGYTEGWTDGWMNRQRNGSMDVLAKRSSEISYRSKMETIFIHD